MFELIENDISLFSENGSVIIMGDMNARTGNESDFIENEFHNQNIPLFENYLPDSDIIDRFSRDHTILPRGRVLNDICIQTGLRILNGRCAGDLTGNLTCHNYRGSSTVDYGLVSEGLLKKVIFFTVHKFLPIFSDHSQISLLLQVNCKYDFNWGQLRPVPVRYRWNEQSSTLYQEALASKCLQEKIKIINSTNYQENTDRLVEDLNYVLCEAADVAMLKKSSKVNKKKTEIIPV